MDLSIDKIRQLCTEASFERGKRYLEEGRVNIAEASPTGVTAQVEGTERYNVNVDLKNGISAECDCPYNYEGYCKHIVAVLMLMLENKEEIDAMMARSRQDQEMALDLLKDADPKELKEFLRKEMEILQPLRTHFMTWFSRSGDEKSLHDYKRDLNKLFRESVGYDDEMLYGIELDFSPFEQLAEINFNKKSFLEAAKIYRALIESIEENIESTGDTGTYYEDKVSSYLDRYVNSINSANLDADAKRAYIKYLFHKYAGNPEFFGSYYLEALKELNVSNEDREYLLRLLDPYMQEELSSSQKAEHSNYDLLELVSTKLRLLWDLGRKADYYGLIEQYYSHSPDLCLLYARSLKEDGKLDQSVSIAEECLFIFPEFNSKSIREFLNGIYEHSDALKYRKNLLWLFLNTSEWRYYEALKASFPESWNDIFAEIISCLSQDSYRQDKLIDVYLKEGMYDMALRKVLESGSLPLMAKYHQDLAGRYPDEYFKAYRRLIHSFAGKETGRRHYKDVVSYLRKMGEIDIFKSEFAEFIDELKQENKRKPAFIDEINALSGQNRMAKRL